MFVNVSALVIAGIIIFAALSHVWLSGELASPPSGSPTEDPQR
jgi:hypothetical protein